MSATIRIATLTDIPTLLRFIRELAAFEKLLDQVSATEETLAHSLFGPAPKAFALLAEVGKEAAGFCIYFYNFSTFIGRPGIYIEDVYVSPAHRSHGIGQQFFRYLAAKAADEQCGRLEWWVLNWNQRAIDFYRSMGAEPMSEWVVHRLTGAPLAALANPDQKVA